MKLKILFIAIMSLLLSCEKESNNPRPIAKGKVIDAVTKQPLANVFVTLYKTEGDFFNPTYELVGEELTDSQGNFNFNRTDAILIRAKKATYFDSKEYDIQDDVYKQTQTIELVPEAFVNVRLINNEKRWDNVIVYVALTQVSPIDVNPGANSEFDSTFNASKIYGNAKFIEYRTIKFTSDKFETNKIIIKPIPHDTISITINY